MNTDIDIASFPSYEEMITYETLWARKGATLKRVSEYLKDTDRPSKADLIKNTGA